MVSQKGRVEKRDAAENGQGSDMTRKFTPAAEAFKEWRKDPEYAAAYAALEEEFATASAAIKACGDAAIT